MSVGSANVQPGLVSEYQGLEPFDQVSAGIHSRRSITSLHIFLIWLCLFVQSPVVNGSIELYDETVGERHRPWLTPALLGLTRRARTTSAPLPFHSRVAICCICRSNYLSSAYTAHGPSLYAGLLFQASRRALPGSRTVSGTSCWATAQKHPDKPYSCRALTPSCALAEATSLEFKRERQGSSLGCISGSGLHRGLEASS